jgi:phosphoribosylanthranilate isomerase
MVRVKICGITNLDDALYAAECGADALGFVFYKGSPRYIEPAAARMIIEELPPFVVPVGLFVDEAPDMVLHNLIMSRVRMLQFHGAETDDFCRGFSVPYFKAFRVKGEETLDELGKFSGSTAFLLDAYSEDAHGGTGRTFDWEVASRAKKHGRIILAGGLTPDNVADAVAMVEPYAVDVSSGVEAFKGKKDRQAVKEFIERAKCV